MSFSPWDAALIALKAVSYAATLVAAGAVFFLGYGHPRIENADRPHFARMLWGCSLLALAACAAQIAVTAGSIGGDARSMLNGSLARMVWNAGQGRAIGIRVFGLLVAVLASPPSRRPHWSASIGAVLAAASFAWVGHAHSLSPQALPMFLISVHLVAAAFWLGALPSLLIVSRRGDPSQAAAAAARFSSLAMFVVGALVAAGVGLLWLMLGDFSGLWRSDYGRWVSLKLGLVAALLGLAALNKWRLTPRLRGGELSALHQLRTSIWIEVCLGASILMVTAAFTTLAGPPALE